MVSTEGVVSETMLASGELPQPCGRLRAEGAIRRYRDNDPRTDAGGVVHVRHGGEPGRARDL